ncbi:hypothetical protein Cgig2_016444 [Carnegiea gigantea]|uniref:Uncharacterized protein n=1 Tax=Carnegiea gigantea TaxID=171969 RepID=A0A9Q1K5A6_9CARY|nr:hypothetical protein Cgig2_016444 [Carnegiea gigantea]
MSEFVIRRFSWDRRGKAFPPSPPPKDFRSLCPDFDLAMDEQTAAHYELLELPQATFYAMLLNEAEKLGVLHGPRLWSPEVALTELHWGAFESWIWLFGDRVYEAQFHPKSGWGEAARAGRWGESSMRECHSFIGRAISDCLRYKYGLPPTRSMREIANYIRETFIWRWRSTSRPTRPLPKDFNVLCPCFSLALAEAEAAAAESGLPEIAQAMFYTMLLNEMLTFSVVHEYTAERMKSLLVGLRWSTFEVWLRIMDEVIQGARFHRQPDEVDVKGAHDGQWEGSRSADPPAPSSDEE